MSVRTKPLWSAMTGPAEIEMLPDRYGIIGVKLAKLHVPVGATKLTIPMSAEVAERVQQVLSLQVVDYAE